jgi:hypothetical protein
MPRLKQLEAGHDTHSIHLFSAVSLGLAAAVASTMALGFLLMPGMLFAAPAALAMEKGHYVIGTLVSYLGQLPYYGLMLSSLFGAS